MKMKETSRVADKKPQVNNDQVIDSSYRGEIIVALHNDSDDAYIVKPGERIAQLVVLPYVPVDFTYVDELDETNRGTGGFGSSGEM